MILDIFLMQKEHSPIKPRDTRANINILEHLFYLVSFLQSHYIV